MRIALDNNTQEVTTMDPATQIGLDTMCPGLGTVVSAAGLVVTLKDQSSDDDD